MLKYIFRRILLVIPVILGVILFTFLIAQVTPGDPVKLMLGPMATPTEIEEMRQQLGYNDPVIIQFFNYVVNVVQGDLGTSIQSNMPVLQEILSRFPYTIELTLSGISLAILLGLVTGSIAALGKSAWVRSSVIVFSLVFISIPIFWFAMLLISFFSVNLGWFAVSGDVGLKALILPAITLAVGPAATISRLTYSSILDVSNEDFVRTARSKGVADFFVTTYHILRNAMVPVVTLVGLQFAGMLGGSVFVESIFSRPGIGSLAVSAISARDYPEVQGVVLFTATIYVLVNLFVDILYCVIDPRIRLD